MSTQGSPPRRKARFSLSSDRLDLRPFCSEDTPFLHELWIDPHVRRYLWDDRVISVNEAAAVVDASCDSFERFGFGMWVLRSKRDDQPVGFCGLRHFGQQPQDVEILYGLLPAHWHLGLATEAAEAVLRFGFAAGLQRIFAGADPPNAASIRVMERLGMHFHDNGVLNGLNTTYFAIEPGLPTT